MIAIPCFARDVSKGYNSDGFNLTLEAYCMALSAIAGIPALKDAYQQLKSRMDKAVEDFRANLAATRTGRASVHMLDTVRVPYYGSEMPLNQVATVHAPEAQHGCDLVERHLR